MIVNKYSKFQMDTFDSFWEMDSDKKLNWKLNRPRRWHQGDDNSLTFFLWKVELKKEIIQNLTLPITANNFSLVNYRTKYNRISYRTTFNLINYYTTFNLVNYCTTFNMINYRINLTWLITAQNFTWTIIAQHLTWSIIT